MRVRIQVFATNVYNADRAVVDIEGDPVHPLLWRAVNIDPALIDSGIMLTGFDFVPQIAKSVGIGQQLLRNLAEQLATWSPDPDVSRRPEQKRFLDTLRAVLVEHSLLQEGRR